MRIHTIKVLTGIILSRALLPLPSQAIKDAVKSSGSPSDYVPLITIPVALTSPDGIQGENHGVTLIDPEHPQLEAALIPIGHPRQPIPGDPPPGRHPRPVGIPFTPSCAPPLPYGLTLDDAGSVLSCTDQQTLADDLQTIPSTLFSGITGISIVSVAGANTYDFKNGKLVLSISNGNTSSFPFGPDLLSALGKSQWVKLSDAQKTQFTQWVQQDGGSAATAEFTFEAFVFPQWNSQLISKRTAAPTPSVFEALFAGALQALASVIPYVTAGKTPATLTAQNLTFSYTASQLQIGDLQYALKDDPANKGGKLITQILYQGVATATGLSVSIPQTILDVLKPFLAN